MHLGSLYILESQIPHALWVTSWAPQTLSLEPLQPIDPFPYSPQIRFPLCALILVVQDDMWDARFNQLMVMKLDENQDGVVDKEEFMSGFAAALQGTKEEVENRVREYHECALFVRSGRHQQVEMALEVEYQRCGLTPDEHKAAEADKAAVKAAAKAAAQAEAEAFARKEEAKMEQAKMATEKVQMEEALVERKRRFKRLLEIFDQLDVDAKGVIGKATLMEVGKARRSLGLDSGKWAAPLAHLMRQSEGLSPPRRGRGQAVTPGNQRRAAHFSLLYFSLL